MTLSSNLCLFPTAFQASILPCDLLPAHPMEVGVGCWSPILRCLHTQVGCPWPSQTLPWVTRELGAKQRDNFITGPHPALDFSLGFVILCLTPCLLGLGTAPGGALSALTSHAPSAGPEPPLLGPSHWAVTLGSLQGLTSVPCDPMSEPLEGGQ